VHKKRSSQNIGETPQSFEFRTVFGAKFLRGQDFKEEIKMTKYQIALTVLREKRLKLDLKICDAIKKAFPVNSEVNFKKGNAEISAIVRQHSDGDRVKIENVYTNKQYWIDAYWLLKRE
jgi:hypothetical protein